MTGRWEDEDPGLPVLIGPASNDEYRPPPLSATVREAMRRALANTDDAVRRLGISRREFLLSASGAAAALMALNACARESSPREPGGRFRVPPESTTEPTAAVDALGGEEFVFDVQGHLLDFGMVPEGLNFGLGFPQAQCDADDPKECFSIERFLTEMFLRSDTNIVVLSSIPIVGDRNPLNIQVMEETRRVARTLCDDGRILLQGQAVPNVGRLEGSLEGMADVVAEHQIVAWKVYTHAPQGRGWALDDGEPDGVLVGDAFIRKAVELGVPRIAVHKGFSGGSKFASPRDIGPAARRHPDVSFIVYHSGYESGQPEGPYTPDTAGVGVNRLITSLAGSGITPNANVYAELGSTWFNVMSSPTEAAHVVGKLLTHVGEDNVVWGTDSIWYGSPQAQIQAFRAFEISAEFQERFGYPALTPERKAKILGLNSARLYSVDPITTPCSFTRAELEEIRKTIPGRNGP